ncbi:MAG: TRAP transporter large permease [Alphaproteobacteria bacterium]|nr:TRAP transporter large permease [Alphaproteobacteria bacterium]
MAFIPLLLMFVFFAIRVPVGFAMGISALVYFMVFADGLPTDIFVQRLIAPTDSFPLLAVPFFILAGVIMNHAGITRRLMAFADALVGHWMGALGQVNVVLATLMGGMSASANADAAMQAKMLGPEMVRRGYTPAFAAAITASASVITPIIPPGIGLIVYGFLADVSVGRLFVGGIVPGILLCASLMLAVNLVARKRGYKPERPHRAPLAEVGRTFVEALGALSIAAFILIGLRYGIFTPTEAGAMAVLYALAIGFFWHRELTVGKLPEIMLEAALSTAVIMIIICCASAFAYYMTWERIPRTIAGWLVTVTREPWLLLLIINVGLIIVGMLIEGTAALILLTPIFVPVITSVGIDPVHFGLVIVVNLTIGGVTPPVGTLMYTTAAIMKVPLDKFTIEALPFMAAMFAVLFLITYVPWLVLFLPNWAFG